MNPVVKNLAAQSVKNIISTPIENAVANMATNKKGWNAFSKSQKNDVITLGIVVAICIVTACSASIEINNTYKSVA
ncbi:MAG: hypothetical protein HZA79_00120 [Sphingobacteriales bacterium]|nr:hypothetical protein [Sphingobacteriales bacterium]